MIALICLFYQREKKKMIDLILKRTLRDRLFYSPLFEMTFIHHMKGKCS